MFTIVNLSGHAVTIDQLTEVGRIRDEADVRVRDIRLGTLNPGQPFADQVTSALSTAFIREPFPEPPYAVLPPGNAAIASTVLAVIHGLTGHFPTIVRLREAGDGRYEVAEFTDLQALRNTVARGMRSA